MPIILKGTSESDEEASMNAAENEGEPILAESVVKVDDGGSNLTDRFKYKVNALMGTYDPVGGAADDENQSGNILNAMLTFPTRYSFNVVGRTGGDADVESSYVEAVKTIVLGGTVRNVEDSDDNPNDDQAEGVSFSSNEMDLDKGMEVNVKPRGKNFVKVSVDVTVESAAVISSIYKSLSEMELTVMNF